MKKNSIKTKIYNANYETEKIRKSILTQDKLILEAIKMIKNTLKNDRKILICGNGGSAADAQHLAAEFLVRLRPNIDRKPLPVLNLCMDTSTLTACSNDYDFENLFERNLLAFGKKGDVLIVISTSGNSKNIIKVLKRAKEKKIKSIGFLGFKGGKAKKYVNLPLIVKSSNVARIQETHIFLGHFIFQEVEEYFIN
tara:strand:- start:392 stop:979 length:588 start_codon:yes stop_codon:yes gene_type:complete